MPGRATINSLNDELLARIFKNEELLEPLFHLPLVCKRWSQVIASDGKLWRSIDYGFYKRTREHLHSFLLWVRAKREHIQCFRCDTKELTSLAAIAQLTALESLTLEIEASSPLQAFIDLLISMPKLQSLEVAQPYLKDEVYHVIDITPLRHLTELSALQLGKTVFINQGAMAASLPHLKFLKASVDGWSTLMPLSRLSALWHLELDLAFTASIGGDLSSLLPTLRSLASLSLKHLMAATDLGLLGDTHTALKALTICRMDGLHHLPPASLELSSLGALTIEHLPTNLDMGTFLFHISGSRVLPGLKRLTMSSVLMPSFPYAVTNLQGLTYLSCGPYSEFQFVSIPKELTSLSQLKQLHLLNMHTLELDVGILLGLPLLGELHIPECKQMKLRDAAGNDALRAMQALQGRTSLVIDFAGTALMC